MNKNLPERAIKQFLSKFYRPFVRLYLRKERTYHYHDVRIKIFPGVFHPGLFFSTKILLSFLEEFDLQKKRFLELGAGSGLIAIIAAKRGALVTATDISKKSLENIAVNKQLNKVALEQFHSDLFDQIEKQVFDFIVVNPPYYKGKISKESDHAWYAGENLEYYLKLFQQLPVFMNENSNVFMILSDDCDVKHIQSIANVNHFVMKMVFSKKIFWETNFIFQMQSLKN